jgi:hypothetical protein
MKVQQDKRAWQEGYDAPTGSACPYLPGTIEALSWASGRIEGESWRRIMRGAGPASTTPGKPGV